MNFAELLHLEWRAPWWGLVALAPLAFWLLARVRPPFWSRYADAALRPWVVRQASLTSGLRWRRIAETGFWVLLAIALAGPRLPLQGSGQTGPARHDIDLMVVLDVSTSMNASDIAPTRLARAKLKLQDVLPRLHGERIGLIAFAGEAGLALPLTQDRDALLQTLPLLDDKLFEEQGTHLAAAFELALKTSDPRRTRALLLLTDADTSALSGAAGDAATHAARALGKANMPLYVLALASDAGDGNPDSRPDFASYAALASLSGGELVRVSDDPSDLASLYDRHILALPGARFSNDATVRWRELFAYPLALAVLLLFASQWRWRKEAVLAGVLAASSTAQAASDDVWREAHEAYLHHQYLVAQQAYARVAGYAGRMGEGAAAYRRQDYPYAVKQFTQAWLAAGNDRQRADALFNLGNAFYLVGNRQAAHDAYAGVLKLRPNDSAALHNLARATVTLAARDAAASVYIPGRKGKGLSEGASDNDRVQELAPDKDTALLFGEGTPDAERARRLGATMAAAGNTSADTTAALKKIDLLRDARRDVLKQSMKQDAKRERPEGLSPW